MFVCAVQKLRKAENYSPPHIHTHRKYNNKDFDRAKKKYRRKKKSKRRWSICSLTFARLFSYRFVLLSLRRSLEHWAFERPERDSCSSLKLDEVEPDYSGEREFGVRSSELKLPFAIILFKLHKKQISWKEIQVLLIIKAYLLALNVFRPE